MGKGQGLAIGEAIYIYIYIYTQTLLTLFCYTNKYAQQSIDAVKEYSGDVL